MNFKEYIQASNLRAFYPNRGNNIQYTLLGLAGEVGEVCNAYKKIIRDKGGVMSIQDKDNMADELGDCLWYLTMACEEIGIPLNIVAELNVEKLRKRHEQSIR